MRKIIVWILTIVLVSAMPLLVACGSKEYTATTRFLYSTDGGKNWSEKIQEVPVGETYWVKVEGIVQRNIGILVEKEIEVYISIPNTDIGDFYLDDRNRPIDRTEDAATGETMYTFKTLAGTDPQPYYAIFECTPLKEGRIVITVSYDDRVSELYTTYGAIKYVAQDTSGEEIDG